MRGMRIKLLSLMVPVIGVTALYNYLHARNSGAFELGVVRNYQAIMPLAIIGSGPAGLTAAYVILQCQA